MKKLLPVLLSVLFLLTACGSHNDESEESVKIDEEKEEMTTQSFLEKAASEHEDIKSYEEQGTLHVTDNKDNSQEIKFIVTHDKDDNLKFEADVDGEVVTYYDVDDSVKKVENGKLKDTNEFSYDGDSSYGSILKQLTNLPKGHIETKDNNYVLTFDIADMDDLKAVFGEELSKTLNDFDIEDMSLELIFNKDYLLTQANAEGELKKEDKTYSVKGITNFNNINNDDTIELPKGE